MEFLRMIDLARARIADARQLIAEYVASLPVDISYESVDRELAELPGAYAPPAGDLLIASVDGVPAGCIALRPIDGDTCEMKRFYVAPAYRGQGVGRRLAEAIVAAASRIGYRRMRLDTHPTMTAAIALYVSLGFRPIEPYRSIPHRENLFMELELDRSRIC
jgi:putative acetyltransferase